MDVADTALDREQTTHAFYSAWMSDFAVAQDGELIKHETLLELMTRQKEKFQTMSDEWEDPAIMEAFAALATVTPFGKRVDAMVCHMCVCVFALCWCVVFTCVILDDMQVCWQKARIICREGEGRLPEDPSTLTVSLGHLLAPSVRTKICFMLSVVHIFTPHPPQTHNVVLGCAMMGCLQLHITSYHLFCACSCVPHGRFLLSLSSHILCLCPGSPLVRPPRLPPHGRGGSFVLGSSRPPPHGRGGLLRFRITEAPAAWAGASFALGPPRPPLRWRGGLLRFGATEAPAALAQGPPSHLDH